MNLKKLSTTEIIILAVLAGALFYAYKKGAFAGPDKGYNIDPAKAVTDGSAPSAPADDAKFKNIARSFRNSMLDNSYSSDIFIEACDSLLTLTDADLISVSNAYNKMYVNDEYNTLRSVLVQEWVTYWSTQEKKKNELLKRFSNLGI